MGGKRRVGVSACLCFLVCASVCLADPNIVVKPAAPLPPPSGAVTYVSNLTDLYAAVNGAGVGATIMIQPGTYILPTPLQMNSPSMVVRGATGNRNDVVLVGNGINGARPNAAAYGFQVNVNGVTIADLTVSGVRYHGVQIRGENSVSNVLIHNIKVYNAGERYIKGSTAAGRISSNVTIENCWFEQTEEIYGHPDNDYIGGIDAMGISNWVIRDCYFKNIHGMSGGGRGGIFLWSGVTDCIAERNVVIGCDRGIAFGNPYRAAGIAYHTTNGIIRNNFVVGSMIGGTYPMELCATRNLKVYNNTLYNEDMSYPTIHVYDGATTGLKLYNNIVQGRLLLNNAGGTVSADTAGSIISELIDASWFVEPWVGDLRLTPAAADAIDQGSVLAEVTDDYFANPRGASPDVGAHEMPPLPPRVAGFAPALAVVHAGSEAMDRVTITFDRAVVIDRSMVSVVGAVTGTRDDFVFSYDQASRSATLQWAEGLPNDTYIVTAGSAVTANGLALDGEVDLEFPSLPSGDGMAGGAFRGAVYRLVGDVNRDRFVNVGDLQVLVGCWAAASGQGNYDPRADLNGDDRVNVGDLQILVTNWGQMIPLAE